MEKYVGTCSVQEFQNLLESCVHKGFLPLPCVRDWQAQYILKAHKKADSKQAKQALLIQLAYVLSMLRLRNPEKRFEGILTKAGIEKSFANELLIAYTNPKEEWGE
jgi:hypothetical protein